MMTASPEEYGKPIVSSAVQDVLVDQFRDELTFGIDSRPDGVGPLWVNEAVRFHQVALALAQQGQATWAVLLMAQALECNASHRPDELRSHLVSLGATVVQWIESLDTRGGV